MHLNCLSRYAFLWLSPGLTGLVVDSAPRQDVRKSRQLSSCRVHEARLTTLLRGWGLFECVSGPPGRSVVCSFVIKAGQGKDGSRMDQGRVVVCLSVLSVWLSGCGWLAGWHLPFITLRQPVKAEVDKLRAVHTQWKGTGAYVMG